MSGQNSEVNRVIDDTAEGHRRVLLGEAEEGRRTAERKTAVKTKVEDAETEGHRIMRAQEAEELRARAVRMASIDDSDEAEGHRLIK